MILPPPRERAAIALWLVAGASVWNGLYDILITRGIKEYLFRQALYESGRGARVPMAAIMDETVAQAIWVCTLWASLIVLCGMITIRLLRQPQAGRST
jgi:hypothetical protein